MNNNSLREHAEDLVFEQEKIGPDSEAVSVVCEADEISVDVSTGRDVFCGQVAVLEQYTDMNVRLDSTTGELVGWDIPAHEQGADSTLVDETQVRELAGGAVEIPRDAQLLEVTFEQEHAAHIATALWRHLVNGVEVEDDCIVVLVNSTTRNVVSVSRIWNDIADHEDTVSEEQAVAIAREKLPEYATGRDAQVIPDGRKFIPVVTAPESGKPVCRYVKTWTVIIDESDREFTRTVTLSIDTRSGEIVRVQNSL
ncbi:MAG: hypothetical protein GF350_03030 [Chitinivibrionales bacterium]|nr:hypothetical protein [Chitinivibrionales bacterium]